MIRLTNLYYTYFLFGVIVIFIVIYLCAVNVFKSFWSSISEHILEQFINCAGLGP